MIANVKIYLNSVFVDTFDVEMAEGDTVDSPGVIAQVTELHDPEAWDTIEIQSIS